MAGVAECHVVGLVLNQQPGLRRSVRLMTGHAIDMSLHFGDVSRVHDVLHRMAEKRMAKSVLNGQDYDFVSLVVILRQLNAAVEDGNNVLGLQLLRTRIWTVAFQA